MNLPLILFGAILSQGFTVAAAYGATPIQTNFVHGTTLSGSELDAVVQLANVCGITNVSRVSTERHLGGDDIVVRGDEKIETRRGRFKILRVRRVGWPGGKLPTTATRSVGAFWVHAADRPVEEERTIVRVRNRTYWLMLSGGVKPEGADKVLGAFVDGRIRYDSDFLKQKVSMLDLTEPTSLTTGFGESWISFSLGRETVEIKFQLNGDEVVVQKVRGPEFTTRWE